MQRLKPLNDFIFGKTFWEKGDEEQLLSLLNAILATAKHKTLVRIEIAEHRTFTAEVSVDDFHTVFHLWEDSHKDCLLTDALEIHFIDVKKFNALPKKDIKNDSLHRWLTFFDQSISDDLLKGLIDMDAAIYKANEKMIFLANDKEVLRLYNMREMAQIDYNSGMKKAGDEGKAEAKTETARNLLEMNMTHEQIAKATGLTPEEINSL
ncbi:Rpn family recombination-promoting nuclease/putative transposase [Otoolea muris]|uniref:Rpn family recombination-promoting nuclease/putative transposase n=1 Tax=Otoolea muris TaxID=2941515 RepID=UPI00203B6F02|nr:Rpn family recombination-promoting nuclease/putative transposase [Otoolea muris]